MELEEKYARHICESRGADPDGDIQVGQPDGSMEYFNPAWKGYVGLSRELLAMHKKESAK